MTNAIRFYVSIASFCLERFLFGTPHEMCDIHGEIGFDVPDGKAKELRKQVLTG